MKSSDQDQVESVVILGTGPAGLTAAIYTARANLRPVCIEGTQPGGQLTLTSDVENYPGFAEPVIGSELMESFRQQAQRFGTRFLQGDVLQVDLSKRPFSLQTVDGRQIRAKALIVATGASAKWMGIPSEKKLMGKGVSACATCDGFFFKNKDIVVVGGGDTAMEEAIFLTRFARKVSVIHRRNQLRASKIMQDKAMKNPKIQFIWDSGVEEILGERAVEGVRLKNLKTGEFKDLKVEGVFIAIGHEPNTSVFRPGLECNESGYILTRERTTQTNIQGLFAAGDVADPHYRQAVTAAGSGCMAAIDAERFLENEE